MSKSNKEVQNTSPGSDELTLDCRVNRVRVGGKGATGRPVAGPHCRIAHDRLGRLACFCRGIRQLNVCACHSHDDLAEETDEFHSMESGKFAVTTLKVGDGLQWR